MDGGVRPSLRAAPGPLAARRPSGRSAGIEGCVRERRGTFAPTIDQRSPGGRAGKERRLMGRIPRDCLVRARGHPTARSTLNRGWLRRDQDSVAQTKLATSSVLPLPTYRATCG